METNLKWENIQEIVFETLDYCENVVSAENLNNTNDYDNVTAHLEDVIDLLNQISVHPVFHNDEIIKTTIQQCRENLLSLQAFFLSHFLQLEHGLRTYEYLQPSNIATLMDHPSFENENEQDNDNVDGTRPGRPKYYIPKAVLVNLREMGYTWTQISEMLLVSRLTIARRAAQYEITGFSVFLKLLMMNFVV